MARWSYLILVVYIVLAVNAQNDESVTTPPETTTKGPDTTTTKPTTTSTSTTSTSTSSSTTTKTTSTTTETTSTPKTTTSAPPAPTPPAPAPQPYGGNKGHWLVNSTTDKNVTCLVLDAAIEVNVVYLKSGKNVTEHVVVPSWASVANVSGSCPKDVVTASLSWTVGNETQSNVVNVTFTQRDSHFVLSEISVDVVNSATGQPVTASLDNQTLFETPLNRSYKCNSESVVKLGEGVDVQISQLRVEPFLTSEFKGFSKEYECSSDDVSTVVPFAVGISLAVLVIIVLAAYLFGRRRSRARGYQSV